MQITLSLIDSCGFPDLGEKGFGENSLCSEVLKFSNLYRFKLSSPLIEKKIFLM